MSDEEDTAAEDGLFSEEGEPGKNPPQICLHEYQCQCGVCPRRNKPPYTRQRVQAGSGWQFAFLRLNMGDNFSVRQGSGAAVLELVLHEAASNGDDRRIEELQLYIRRGRILVNQPDAEWGNRTPLHCAAERGNPRSVKLLLEAGANPSARMTGGFTPAHCAAEAGRADNLQMLVDFRAPINIPDDYGDTPRKVAETYGEGDCAELLRRAEENPVPEYSFRSKKLWGTVHGFTEEIHENIQHMKKTKISQTKKTREDL